MEKANRILVMCLLAFAVFGLQSCLDDCDDNSYYQSSAVYPNALVTVKTSSTGHLILQLNDSTVLWPVNMEKSPFGDKEVRALVNYRAPEGKEFEKAIYADIPNVYINWIDSILTKPTAENKGEGNQLAYGADPVEIVNDWVTVAEDGYLTLRFRTRWSRGVQHQVNLVVTGDADNPYKVTFYHNAKGDVNGSVGDGIVAFRLAGLPDTQGQTVHLTLEWQSYSGTKTTKFKYRTPPYSMLSTDTPSNLGIKSMMFSL